MTTAEDVERIIEQERRLVFSGFDEGAAFAIGSAIRERALQEGLSLVADVRLWDRPLFYMAMPGTPALAGSIGPETACLDGRHRRDPLHA